MQPSINYARRKLYLALAGLLLVFLLIKCLNTPKRDSSERPMPRKTETALRQAEARALHQADSLKAVADSAVARSRAAYAQGVAAGKEAAELRLETHQKPTPHAQAPTPATTKQLQQFFNDY